MIGGGKGLSNILSGLKEYTHNITSIVSTFDDGGSTGKIMEQMDTLPPGDIRRSLIALSSSDEYMEKMLSYRFKDGAIDNHSLGNLMIAAMTDVMGGFAPAIQAISHLLFPATPLPTAARPTLEPATQIPWHPAGSSPGSFLSNAADPIVPTIAFPDSHSSAPGTTRWRPPSGSRPTSISF